MERRKALATAASVSAVALAATLAMGANVGLFGLTSSDNGPGSFKLVDSKTSEPIVRTEIVDVPISAPGSTGSTPSSKGGSTTGPTSPSVSSDGTHSTPTVATTPRSDDDDDSHAPEDEPEHEDEPAHDEDD